MTANGLIVAFVVAVWAAYFVPLVLRRYDEASKSSSLESLSHLSRVIPRRQRTEDAVAERAPEEPERRPKPEPVVETAQASAAPGPRPGLTRASARLAARRRRRTLITLLAALAVVGGLAVGSVVAPVWVAVPAALVVAWLVACRIQVRSEYGAVAKPAKAAGRTPAAESAPVRRTVDDEATVVISGQLEDVDPGRKHRMQIEALPADALDEQLVIAVPSVATTGEALWDPLPVTLPTYVTKPRVGRTVRTIDFTAPGTWSSGHVEGESVELPGAPARDAATAERQEPRRASGQ